MNDLAPSPKLLILDDIEEVGTTIAATARSVGYDSRAVADPIEFFGMLESWSPQVLVIDLVMPKMDGIEVIRRLASLCSEARLIISSGVGSRVLDAAQRAADEHGLDIVGVLSKPFRSADLRTMLIRAQSDESAAPALRRPSRGGTAAPILEADFAEAIAKEQLRLVYQPKIDCTNGRVLGFEALLRWIHPMRGAVPPDEFISLAERSGLIHDVTAFVVVKGLSWLSSTPSYECMGLAINVSALNLDRQDFARRTVAACREHEIATDRLTLELTETAAMSDPVVSLALFAQLRTQGFALSIDDFGTGYSSMVQLVRLPFSEMKIDRSFVMTALRSPESRAVIECIAGLSRGLGLSVVAEGVEDLAVIRLLQQVGCGSAQGFAISRPLEAEQVPGWLEQWNARLLAQPWAP